MAVVWNDFLASRAFGERVLWRRGHLFDVIRSPCVFMAAALELIV